MREGPGEIRRIWGQRAAVVTANLAGFDMGGVSRQIRANLVPIRTGTALNLDIGGQGRDMESALDNMMLALYLARPSNRVLFSCLWPHAGIKEAVILKMGG